VYTVKSKHPIVERLIKTLIVYTSLYGNTEKIAMAMGRAINADVKKPLFGVLSAGDLNDYDLLIMGSPTQDGRQMPSIRALLDVLPPNGLKEKKVAAFDTRHKWKLVGIWGYAAPRIAKTLQTKRGMLIAPPEGFYVSSTKGPLAPGELARAEVWAKSLVEKDHK
jgi:flavodoxin I